MTAETKVEFVQSFIDMVDDFTVQKLQETVEI